MATTPQQGQQTHTLAVAVASALAAGGATLAGLGPAAAGLAAEKEAAQQGAQLSARAVAELTEQIVKLMLRFLRERAGSAAQDVRALLARDYPERPPADLDALVREEVRREQAFRDKMASRLRRDLPEALRDPDADRRRARLQAILDRERRYVELRDQAMHDRAVARAEMLAVKEASPLGAYWALSPYVASHTPDCVALAGKFWPWPVVEAVGPPPRHHGCACQLLTLHEAVERGWMDPRQAEGIDVPDALRRARDLLRDAETIEALVSQDEFEAWLVELAVEAAAADETLALLRRVADDHMPEGGYGQTAWNPETGTVYWVAADWMSDGDVDAAVAAFKAVHGVRDVETDAETNAPSRPPWVPVNFGEAADEAELPRHRRPQRCKYGDHPATMSLIHAEGAAYVPVCDAHEARARRKLGAGEVNDVARIVDEAELALAEAPRPRRYPKGFEHGGEFMPTRGGDPGRRVAGRARRALLRRLVPELPPPGRDLMRRREPVPIEGRRVFVPEGRAFDRTIGGRRYTSPPFSRHVYRDGAPFEPAGQPTGQAKPAAGGLDAVVARHPDVKLWASERSYGIKVSMIETPKEKQGQGLATAAMKDLLDYADSRGLPVALTPGETDRGRGGAGGHAMSKAKLAAWYKRLGFVPNKGRNKDFAFTDTMIRQPRRGQATPGVQVAAPARPAAERVEARRFLSEPHARVQGALAARDPDHRPVKVGQDARGADDALYAHGFVETDTAAAAAGRDVTYRAADGASELTVRFGYDGKVAKVEWRPADAPAPPRPLTRPPRTFREFSDDLRALAAEVAGRHGRAPLLGDVSIDQAMGDHAGEHQWDGTVVLGADYAPSVLAAAAARRRTGELPAPVAADAWAAHQGAAHEALHAASPFDKRLWLDPSHRALNEALVEELSNAEAERWLRRTGQDDVLRWRADSPSDPRALGTYSAERSALSALLDRAKVAPELRGDFMDDLYHDGRPADRLARLAAAISAAQGTDHAAALQEARDALADPHDWRSFAPTVVPDHPPTEGARSPFQLAGHDVRHGDRVTVTARRLRDGDWHAEEHHGTVDALTDHDDGRWTMNVRRDDGTLEVGVLPSQVAGHDWHDKGGTGSARHARPFGAEADAADVGHGTVRPGTLIRYDGRQDGGTSVARVTRVLRDRNPHDPAHPGWVVEAVTTDDSLRPGTRVILTPERTGAASPAGRGDPSPTGAGGTPLARPAARLEDLARLGRWFDLPAGTFVVGRDRLVLGPLDPPAQVDAAVARMDDPGARRLPPLEVHPTRDGRFLVTGGAAAFEAATRRGLSELPVVLDAVAEVDRHIRAASQHAATSEVHAGAVEGLRRAREILAAGGGAEDVRREAMGHPRGDPEGASHADGVQVGFRSAFMAAEGAPGRAAMASFGAGRPRGQAKPGVFASGKPGGWPWKKQQPDEAETEWASGPALPLFPDEPAAGGRPRKQAPPRPKWDDSRQVRLTGSAGGSNGARFGEDEEGRKWLVKSYNGDADRVATELLANAVYRKLGIAVPEAGSLSFGGRPALAYPLVDGVPGGSKSGVRVRERSRALAKGFMADALLANWDVVGLEHDNLLWPDGTTAESWTADTEPTRLDQGGSLQFRAMGGGKPFGPVPTEVWTMAGPRGQAFSTMALSDEEKRSQAAAIASALTPGQVDALVDAAPFEDAKMRDEVRQALKARVSWMGDYASGKVDEPRPAEGEAARRILAGGQKDLELFPEQEVALQAWGDGWDALVNDHLRTGAPKEAAAREVRFLVGELDSLTRHVSTAGDVTAYAALSGRVRPDEGWEALQGRTLDERGFLGLSTRREAADAEGAATLRLLVPERSHVVALHAIPGTDAGSLAAQPELLASRRSRLHVVRVAEEDGRTVIDAVLMP